MGKPTLYELLGVSPHATADDIRAAGQAKLAELDQQKHLHSPDALRDKAQMLRLAQSTLTDASSRLTYDAKLAATPGQTPYALQPMGAVASVGATGSGVGVGGTHAIPASAYAQALSLRADALSLRADALMVQSAAMDGRREPEFLGTAGKQAMSTVQRLLGMIGALVLLLVVSFFAMRGYQATRAGAVNQQTKAAHEKAALLDYEQTYGKRPANMAELEKWEAERRRGENQQREAAQDKDRQERQQRQFEEESRRRAEDVTRRLELAEQRAKWEADRERERERDRQQMQALRTKELELAKEREERQRIERQRQEWQSILRR